MLQKDAPKAHLAMIRRVARRDKKAAIYLKSRLKEYTKGDEDYDISDSIVTTITFMDTPQGFEYWYDIAIKLGEW